MLNLAELWQFLLKQLKNNQLPVRSRSTITISHKNDPNQANKGKK